MLLSTSLAGVSCLVLGGGGFIGTNLCRALVSRGAHVEIFGRSLSFPKALDNIAWSACCFSDQEALARAIKGKEIVFHLINNSIPESSNKNPVSDLIDSTINTIHFLDICRLSGVRRVIFASSGGTVYGVTRTTPIFETAPTDPISSYGINKLSIEKYLGLYRHLYFLDYTVLRISNPYGPFQTAYRQQGVIAALVNRALVGDVLEIWGDGEVIRDFIYVDDVVEAMIAVLGYSGSHHVFNVGSGFGRSVNTVIADIEAVLDRGPLSKLYKTSRSSDVPVNVLDCNLIRQEVGWEPRTDWIPGLRKTINWCRQAQGDVGLFLPKSEYQTNDIDSWKISTDCNNEYGEINNKSLFFQQ